MKLKIKRSMLTNRVEAPAPEVKAYGTAKLVYIGLLVVLVLWLVWGQVLKWLSFGETGLVVYDTVVERVTESGELEFVAGTGTHVVKGDLLFTLVPASSKNAQAAQQARPLAPAASELDRHLAKLRAELAGVQVRIAEADKELWVMRQAELGRWGLAGKERDDLRARAAGLRAEIAALPAQSRQPLAPQPAPPPQENFSMESRANGAGRIVARNRSAGEHVRAGEEIMRIELDRNPRFEVLVRASQYSRVAELRDGNKLIPVTLPDGSCVHARIDTLGTTAWDDKLLGPESNAEGAAPYLAVLTPVENRDIKEFSRMAAKARFGHHFFQPRCGSWL